MSSGTWSAMAVGLLLAASAACGGTAGDAGASADDERSMPVPMAAVATYSGGCVDLSCTGLYSDWSTKTVDSSNRAYAPAVELWADGAEKSRWIHLPAGTRIDTSDPDEWIFPVGTRIWKEFRLSGKRVETRMLSKGDAGWTFAVYRWSDDEGSAPLLLGGEQNVLGTSYEVPPVSECPECHGGRQDRVMGFELVGLGMPGATGLTLSALVEEGLLTDPPSNPRLVAPEDATGKAAAALAWLHANCGNACHNANPDAMASFTGLHMKLTASMLGAGAAETDTVKTAANVASSFRPLGESWVRIAPGDSAHSLIPRFDATRGPNADGFLQMPPLGTHVPDMAGVALVKAWIDAMEGGYAGAAPPTKLTTNPAP